MAKLIIEAGQSVDVISPAEMAHILLEQEIRLAAKSAGYKWTETPPIAVTNPATGLAGNPTYLDTGPQGGWAWKLRIISCVLAATGGVAVFKGENANGRIIASALTVNVAGLNIAGIFFPDDIIVNSGQQLFVSAGAGSILTYYRGAVQVPAERMGEVLS